MKTKYDLDWVIQAMDKNYIIKNTDTVIELLTCMKDELGKRKIEEEIKFQHNIIEQYFPCIVIYSNIEKAQLLICSLPDYYLEWYRNDTVCEISAMSKKELDWEIDYFKDILDDKQLDILKQILSKKLELYKSKI